MLNTTFRNILLGLLFLFSAVSASMAAPSHTAHTFNVRDGLPSNSLSSVAEDDNGLIWIGTWNGLSFYDGYRFFTFRSDKNGSLSTNRILSIRPDIYGNVWVVTYDHKVNLLDNTTGQFSTLVSVAGAEGAPADSLDAFTASAIYPSGDDIWMESKDGRNLLHVVMTGNTDDPYEISLVDVSRTIPGAKRIRKIVTDSSGRTWLFGNKGMRLSGTDVTDGASFAGVARADGNTYLVTTDGRLYMYKDGRGLQLVSPMTGDYKVKGLMTLDNSYLVAPLATGIGIYNIKQRQWNIREVPGGTDKIYIDSMRRIWIMTGDGRVALTDASGAWHYVETAVSGSAASTTFMDPLFLEDDFGTIWLAPREGKLGYYDPAKSCIVPSYIVSPLLRYTALPEAEKYFIDSNRNLWIISAHGLSLVNFNYQNFRNLHLEHNQETRSMCIVGNGDLVAGSAKGVVGCYTPDGVLRGYFRKSEGPDGNGRVSLSSVPERFSDKVYALYEDGSGNLWVGTKGDGLYVVAPSGELQHYTRRGPEGRRIPCDTVYSFDTDTRGRLWVGTYSRGLLMAEHAGNGYKFTRIGAGNKTYPADDGFSYVRRITHNDRGEMAVSTNSGILTFSDKFTSPSQIKFYATRPVTGEPHSLSTSNVMQVLVARDGNVYATSMGGEVQKLSGNTLLADNLKFDRPNNPDLSASLSRGNVLSMIQDKAGNFYFVRESDIVAWLPADNSIVMLGRNILGGEHEFSEAMPVMGPDGNLYFGSVGSVVKVDPVEVAKEPFAPNIIFTGLQFEGDNKEQFVLNPHNIELQPDHRNFSLSLAALDYSGRGHIEYAYRFDPDTTWTYLGTSNVLQITNLKPGVSRLYIRSTNGDGTWVDNARYVDILVHPSFWETIWAKILLALIFIGVAIFLVHYYNVYRRNRLMDQMRRREHDFYVNASHRLRTPLSLIGSPVYEVLKHENLSDTAREHLERVRRNAKNMLDVVNSMLEAEFKPSGLYSDTDMKVANDDADMQGYMAAQNWLEVRDPEHEEVHKDIKILIVEDNDDLRGFLRDILSSQYDIITAANGKEGLEMAESRQPDFILTDVTMPEMDGLTMVKKIKSKKQLSHIPVLVLSAKASIADRMEGLRIGIDDYISKPFSATYLRQRIANIIAQRKLLQQNYFEQFGRDMQKNAHVADDTAADSAAAHDGDHAAVQEAPDRKEYKLETPQIIEADQLMMEKLMKFLEQRIGDENLRIEEMADAVSMGRTVFYGKIKAIVGMSPSDFLRSLRMQRAEELIVKSKMNFSQIAFSVGFSDPKYFTKCFKKETGMTPSEYRQQKTAEK